MGCNRFLVTLMVLFAVFAWSSSVLAQSPLVRTTIITGFAEECPSQYDACIKMTVREELYSIWSSLRVYFVSVRFHETGSGAAGRGFNGNYAGMNCNEVKFDFQELRGGENDMFIGCKFSPTDSIEELKIRRNIQADYSVLVDFFYAPLD